MIFEALARYLQDIKKYDDSILRKLNKMSALVQESSRLLNDTSNQQAAQAAQNSPVEEMFEALKSVINDLNSKFEGPIFEYQKAISIMVHALCEHDSYVVESVHEIFCILQEARWVNEEILETVVPVWADGESTQASREDEFADVNYARNPAFSPHPASGEFATTTPFMVGEGIQEVLTADDEVGLFQQPVMTEALRPLCVLNERRCSPLHVLACFNPEAVPYFLGMLNGFNIEEALFVEVLCAQDVEGNTPLHLLARHKHILKQLVEYLLTYPSGITTLAHVLNLQNKNGLTGFHLVLLCELNLLDFLGYLSQSERGHSALLNFLIQPDNNGYAGLTQVAMHSPGIMPKLLDFLMKNAGGRSVLFQALTQQDNAGWPGAIKLAIDRPEMFRRLWKKLMGSPVGREAFAKALVLKNKFQWTGLDLLARHSAPVFYLLVKNLNRYKELRSGLVEALCQAEVKKWPERSIFVDELIHCFPLTSDKLWTSFHLFTQLLTITQISSELFEMLKEPHVLGVFLTKLDSYWQGQDRRGVLGMLKFLFSGVFKEFLKEKQSLSQLIELVNDHVQSVELKRVIAVYIYSSNKQGLQRYVWNSSAVSLSQDMMDDIFSNQAFSQEKFQSWHDGSQFARGSRLFVATNLGLIRETEADAPAAPGV